MNSGFLSVYLAREQVT